MAKKTSADNKSKSKKAAPKKAAAKNKAPEKPTDGGVQKAADAFTAKMNSQIAKLEKDGSKNRVRKLKNAMNQHRVTLRLLQ